MFKGFFTTTAKKKRDRSSEFSRFFREASSGDKKKVFLDVARKASKEQLNVIQQSAKLAR